MIDTLLRFAIRNLGRHKRRTLLVGGGVAIGVAAAVIHGSLVAGVRRQMIEHLIVTQYGHATVSPGISDAPAGSGAPEPEPLLESPAAILALIHEVLPEAEAVPALAGLGMVFSEVAESARVAFQGIAPEQETDLLRDQRSRMGHDPAPLEAGSVWLGAALALRLEVARGDTLSLGAFVQDGSFDVLDFRVADVLAPGAPWEDHFVYLRLEDLQELLGVGDAVSLLKVRLPSGARGAHAAVERLREAFLEAHAGVRIEPYEVAGQLFMAIIQATSIQAGVVEVVLLIAIGLGTAGAQILSVHERRREIGMMAALGTPRGSILTMILLEGAALAVSFGALGAALGAVATGALSVTGIGLDAEAFRWMVGAPRVVPRIDLLRTAMTFAGLILIVTLAGLSPAVRASRLLPIEALRPGSA